MTETPQTDESGSRKSSYGNGNGNGNGNERQHLPVAATGHQEIAEYNPYTQPEWIDDEINVVHLWRIISKYRWLILSSVAVCVVTTAIACMMMRPVYRASALIELQPNQRIVKFENLQQANTDDREYLNTQMNILRSQSIADAVIEDMNLAGDPEFSGELEQRGLAAGINAVKQAINDAFSAVAGTLSSNRAADPQLSAEDVPPEVFAARERVDRYLEKLTVQEVPNSDLVRVNFDSFSRRKAATLANAHTRVFIEASDRHRFNSTSSAKQFLQRQIEQTQADLEASEKTLTDFAREHNIVDVEDRSNVMETRLEDLSKSLTAIRQKRINAQVEYKQAQEGTLATLPAVLEADLIKTLREQYALVRSEYQEMSSVFKEKYPQLQQLKSRMENLESTLDEESRKLIAGLKNRYEQLLAEETELANQVAEQRNELLNLKDRAISYNILKREWEANKELYSGLLEKQKDVSVAAGMEVNNISVRDEAVIPIEPHSPKTTRNVAVAGAFGMLGGISIAFLLAFLDNTFKTREELEQALGMPFLGIIPKSETDGSGKGDSLALISQRDPTSPIAQASRSIRTNVLFSRQHNVPRKILVTSTASGEGKSTFSTNLALALVQNGARVLVMETDLRRPCIAKWMNIKSAPGLREYLVGDANEILKSTPYDNLYCVPAGGQHDNPTDLLASGSMDGYLNSLSKHFDFIILDGPPVLGIADSVILSSKVDGAILVVKAGSTEKQAVQETVKRLRTINAPLIGSVLNYVDLTQREYGYYENYYYGYGSKKKENVEHQPEEAESV